MMQVSCDTSINASPQQVWDIVSDIEHADQFISAIKGLEVIEKPDNSIVGFKWKETREMFGKDATEVMWVTAAEAPNFYEVKAESHGCTYISTIRLTPETDSTRLSMTFEGISHSFMAKLMSALMGFMIKKTMVKELNRDLADIKSYIEQKQLNQGQDSPQGTEH